MWLFPNLWLLAVAQLLHSLFSWNISLQCFHLFHPHLPVSIKLTPPFWHSLPLIVNVIALTNPGSHLHVGSSHHFQLKPSNLVLSRTHPPSCFYHPTSFNCNSQTRHFSHWHPISFPTVRPPPVQLQLGSRPPQPWPCPLTESNSITKTPSWYLSSSTRWHPQHAPNHESHL